MTAFRMIRMLKSGTAPVVMGAALLAGPAFAADGDNAGTAPAFNPNQEIVVTATGSRIKRTDLVAASPVAVISAETLKVTNSATVETYLSQQPQFIAATTATTNNGAGGNATVDLRALGPSRTLVLIDGRRMVPGDIFGPVDINAIPSVLIKQVEVLTGGASSVYGADAIAGVVNFILDDKFTGLKADAGTSITTYGDARELNFDAAYGTKVGDGHFVFAAQYNDRQGVYQSARDYSACCGLSSNAAPTAIDINSGRYQVDNSGNFVPFYKYYNYNPANYLSTPMKRYSFMGILTYPVSDHVNLTMRGSYSRTDVTAQLAPTATGGYNFIISPNNPYLNAANYNLIFGDPANLNSDGTANVAIRRRIVETPGRIEKFKNNVYYGIAELKGDFGNGYSWEVFGQYGKTSRSEDLLNDLSYNRVTQAINAVSTPSGPACADPSGGCVPLNLFTTDPIPASALSFILANGHQQNEYDQIVAGGSVSGSPAFLKSPLADKPAALVLGVEYRRESGNQIDDAAYSSGDLIYYGQGSSVPNASYDAKEVYGEFKMPLVTDKPGIRALNLEAGVRYSGYTNHLTDSSNTYDAVTFKAGGDWEPTEGFRVRAIFNRATRDPNINELNAPLTQNGTDVLSTDPCSGANPVGNAALTAKCIAQGAPAASIGHIQDVIANQVNILIGGNGKLKPEVSNTVTLGLVFTPPQIPRLHATIDFYDIKIDNYINGDSASDVVDKCFTQNIALDCSLIVRNTVNGQLSGSVTAGVEEVMQNIASMHTRGIDLAADYKFKFDNGGALTVAFAGTYIDKWEFNQTTPLECAGHYGNACVFLSGGTGNSGNPMPKWRHNVSLTWQKGPFTLFGQWRYFGSVSADALTTGSLLPTIPSYSWFDATAGWDITRNYTLRLGVKNMFNISPPNVGASAGSSGSNSGNTFPQVYDPLGRVFFVNVGLKF